MSETKLNLSEVFHFGVVVYANSEKGYVITWSNGCCFHVFRLIHGGSTQEVTSFYKNAEGWKQAQKAAEKWLQSHLSAKDQGNADSAPLQEVLK